ncbi:hypothetical protein DAPPUDRAFT_241433 [Daphnia pulex]|uniref:Ionotropic glutamate receptor C-terminal domain-containing protein n=1 Tax=Daphnia pulex TaxID=6669 RepID=E9GE89_DAPPU|nr:hypothetical protein DAPPUDRAFT_241433 [Daphnia pulex]|eukprot:EFX82353.1 hypothetical protein DAPPUDRAFT_241433 [Daphnia pulex]
MSFLPFLTFFTWFIISFHSSSPTPNPLSGQHLRVIWAKMIGHGYLTKNNDLSQQSELLVHDTIATFQYNSVVDFTLPWVYDHFAFLIPVPDETVNINAVVKPFQWPVWLGLGVSIACVIAVLNLIQRYLEYRSGFEMNFKTSNKTQPENLANGNQLRFKKWQTEKQYLYVFGNLLSQGGLFPSKRLPYRLVAGVWTLAAFFFVQSYTSTLFTYVVTPINHPLINSIYDANVYLKDVIRNDFKKTGTCNLQLAKEGFIAVMSSLVLPKNSPYTQTISQG